MKESMFLRFLYHTYPGRGLLKILVQPEISKAVARFMSSPLSRPLVSYYIRKYNIDLSGCIKKRFYSFNDFFTRKKKIHTNSDNSTLISPCDGYLSLYTITDDLIIDIKHSRYTVADLLESKETAELFSEGICCIFRLEPRHYHRYLYAVSGEIKGSRTIRGILHCVRPIACAEYPVYVQNSRNYTLIQSDCFGSVIQMEIGALLVGKINNYKNTSVAEKGKEKGYFEYGGSTIVLLFQNNKADLLPRYKAVSDTGCEIPVMIGQILGRIPKRSDINK